MIKNNYVYGIIGIGVKHGNYNAGFDKYPKETANGTMYATPQCINYAIRNQLLSQGKIVLYRKTLTDDGVVNGLKERYESIFGEIKDKKDIKTLNENLFKADDIRLFGCTFATGQMNSSITGNVQIGYGINKFEESMIEETTILSPFANNKGKEGETEDKKGSSLGNLIFVDEAHYLHPFTINPKENDDFLYLDNYAGFTDNDYEMFKESSMIAVSNLNSKSKQGCKNEFNLFVEMEDETGNLVDLNLLNEYVKVYKEDEKLVYDLTDLIEILKKVIDKIKSIEVYYNEYTIMLKGNLKELKKTKVFSLLTREEI